MRLPLPRQRRQHLADILAAAGQDGEDALALLILCQGDEALDRRLLDQAQRVGVAVGHRPLDDILRWQLHALVQCLEQLDLVLEVPVDGAPGHPGRVGDQLQRGARHPVHEEQPLRCVQNLLPGLFRLGLGAACHISIPLFSLYIRSGMYISPSLPDISGGPGVCAAQKNPTAGRGCRELSHPDSGVPPDTNPSSRGPAAASLPITNLNTSARPPALPRRPGAGILGVRRNGGVGAG